MHGAEPLRPSSSRGMAAGWQRKVSQRQKQRQRLLRPLGTGVWQEWGQKCSLLLRELLDQLYPPASACSGACTLCMPFSLNICPHSQGLTQQGRDWPGSFLLMPPLFATSLYPIRHNRWHGQLVLLSPKAELGQSRGKFVSFAQ